MHGEAHYALANEWLASDVRDLGDRYPDTAVTTVEWSVWSGTGMGERLSVLESLERLGVTPIPIETGLATFLALCAAPPVTAEPFVVSSRYGTPPSLPDPRRDLPILRFLETPKQFTPGVELVCDSELSWDTDPYLGEHTLNGLGVLPAVIGLEAMAQAVLAVTGRRPLEFERLRFEHPIFVAAGESVTIRVAVLVRDINTVDLALRSATTRFDVDHFLGIARLAPSARSLPEIVHLEDGPAATPRPAELYSRLLSHGARFQRLGTVSNLHADWMTGRLAPASSNWFSSFLPSELVLGEPGARDSFVHSAQATLPRRRFIPQAVDRIRLVGPASQLRSALKLVVNRVAYSGRDLQVDVQVQTPSSELVETWEGLRLRDVGAALSPAAWTPALVGPVLEGLVEQASGGRRSVRIGVASSTEGGGDSRIRALARTADRPPVTSVVQGMSSDLVEGADDVTECSVNGSDLSVAAVDPHGRTAVICAPVLPGRRAEARRSTVEGDVVAARQCAEELSLTEERAELLVQTARECLRRVSVPDENPLTRAAVAIEGGAAWKCGAHDVVATVLPILGHGEEYAFGVVTEQRVS